MSNIDRQDPQTRRRTTQKTIFEAGVLFYGGDLDFVTLYSSDEFSCAEHGYILFIGAGGLARGEKAAGCLLRRKCHHEPRFSTKQTFAWLGLDVTLVKAAESRVSIPSKAYSLFDKGCGKQETRKDPDIWLGCDSL